VVRVALENPVPVLSVLPLTEATLTEIPEERKSRVPEMEPDSESMEQRDNTRQRAPDTSLTIRLF
jgi:hypothetical protein